MPCHSWILDQVHSQGCHQAQFCDRTRQCGVSAFAERKTLNGLFRQWWFYLKRELYLDVLAFPHVDELKLLQCALVIEPASRKEEDFVGAVLLQLKRDLESSIFSLKILFLCLINAPLTWSFASVLLSLNLLWWHENWESLVFYLVGQAGTRWDRESGAVSCKNDWLHLKSNKSFALDVQISYPVLYCMSSPRSGNRGARACRGVFALLCSSTSAAFTTWTCLHNKDLAWVVQVAMSYIVTAANPQPPPPPPMPSPLF